MARPLVLVADDVREIRDMLRQFLEPQFDVIVARNGEEAWELFNAEAPDIVLSDCVMPRVNGIELLKRIKMQSLRPDTPVVMITAATSGSDIADGLWGKISGSDGFISKPFSPTEVLRRISDILDEKHVTRVNSEPSDAISRL